MATFTKSTQSHIDVTNFVETDLPSGATILFVNATITGAGHQYVTSVQKNNGSYYLSYVTNSTDTVARAYTLNVLYTV